jgi:hypothetical protein
MSSSNSCSTIAPSSLIWILKASCNMSLQKFTALLALLLLSTPVFSFTTNQRISHVTTTSRMHSSNRKVTPLFSTEPEQNDMTDIPLPETSIATPSEPEGTQYPIDAPSPLLLATSMVLAIVGTGEVSYGKRIVFLCKPWFSLYFSALLFFFPTIGSAFELVNPEPKFGFAITAVLTLVSLPLCLFLFYASVLKATAETEVDDKEFMKGR